MKLKEILFAAGVGAMIAACSEQTPPDEPEAETDVPEAPDTGETEEPAAPETDSAETPDTEDAPGVELIKLDCGTIDVLDLDIFSTEGDYSGQQDTFTDTCWLVRHPDGTLLWDLGLPSGLAAAPEPQTSGVFRVSLDRTIADQLPDHGLGMEEIDYVSISHSHFDHTGQAPDLAAPVWLVNQEEYDFMFPADGADGESADAQQAAVKDAFAGLEREIIADEHDVFGDGSVIIFKTPGHTPGHASLQVQLDETGPVLLTGDLWHRAESRELGRVPQFNTSEARTRESFEAFEARAEELGATVIIQHEPADTDPLSRVMK